jgi:hypothetical protein
MPQYPPTMPYKVFNFGAGVQSTTLLLLMREKRMPRPHIAVFSDVGWEPPAVYKHLEWSKTIFEEMEIPLHIVSKGTSIRDDHTNHTRGLKALRTMPFFMPPKSISSRICTDRYKIEPITRLIVKHMKKRDNLTRTVEQWFGISTDEAERERICQRKRWTFKYPLLYTIPMSRKDCIAFLSARNITAPKSSCIACPYHNKAEWIEISKDKQLWADACAFDKDIRQFPNMTKQFYVHPSRKPLSEVNFATEPETPGMIQECTGMCGL